MQVTITRWLFVPCCLALLPLSLSRAAECPPPSPVADSIKVFVTNDVHGYVVEDAKKGRIGYARLKGRIEECEKLGYKTFLLDAGDAFSGSAYAQFDSGRSVAALMGKMGYRALAPGNHAFDYNLPEKDPLYYSGTLLKTVADNDANPLSAVAVNLSRNGSPLPGVGREPVILYDDTGPGGGGLRLIVAGVITPYAASATNKGGLDGYDFGVVTADGKASHAATRQAVLDLLAAAVRPYDRPGDVVVVLSHVGHDDSEDYARGQLTGRDVAAVPNVDFVADAHSHTRASPEWIGQTVYGSGGRYLEGYQEITLTAAPGGVYKRMELKVHDDVAGARPSAAILSAIDVVTEKLGMNDMLFDVAEGDLLTDKKIHLESTALGRFLCRTMAEITGADLALYNSGGIRSGLSSGPVTVGNIYNATPFMNDLQTFAMTGGQITDMFNALPAIGTNGFPQFYGMTAYAWAEGAGPSPRLRVAGIVDKNGVPLAPDKTYAVAMNSFMAGGGDGFAFDKEKVLDNFGDQTTVMIRHFREMGDPRLEEVHANNTLIIFANEALAREAWRKAGGDAAIEKAA